MTDWQAERVRALVAAAQNAVQRTRWNFLVLNMGCAIMISAQLNLYIPWAYRVRKRIPTDAYHDETVKNITKALWDDLYNVSIPLLGIKYSADDLIILGTATMSILALWYVYAHRRENHCIGVLKDIACTTDHIPLVSYIHDAVAHNFVFTPTTLNDHIYGGKGTRTVLRGHIILLIHLPWIASFLSVIVMGMTLFIPGIPLVQVLDDSKSLFFQVQTSEQVEALLRMAWGLAFTFLTGYYCVRAREFDASTRQLLAEMNKAASIEQKSMNA